MQRRNFVNIAAAAAFGFRGELGLAQERGSVIRFIVPTSPGGLHDLLIRTLAESLGKTLNRTIVVDNRPGAATLVGTRALQNAPADGATHLLMTFSGFVALPFTQKSARYEPAKDFASVAMFGNAPGYLLVNAAVPATTLPELIAYARTQPSGLEAATSGPGGWSHVWTLMLVRRAGMNLLPVPYKGLSEMSVALMTGEAKLMLTAYTESLASHVKAGKLRVIAVTSEQPTAFLPAVRPIGATLPGFVVDSWFGLHAHRSMPQAEIVAISEAVRDAVAQPAVREKFAAQYVETRYEGPVDFTRTTAATTEAWRRIAAELKLVPE